MASLEKTNLSEEHKAAIIIFKFNQIIFSLNLLLNLLFINLRETFATLEYVNQSELTRL
jgi:hypothetical protein